eukprot:3637082-Amphidinium_carterae.1
MEHELNDESQGVEVNKLGLFREVELTSSTVQHETLQAKGHVMVKPSEVLSSTGTEREKWKQAASKELSSILEKALSPATESDWRDAHDPRTKHDEASRVEIVPGIVVPKATPEERKEQACDSGQSSSAVFNNECS